MLTKQQLVINPFPQTLPRHIKYLWELWAIHQDLKLSSVGFNVWMHSMNLLYLIQWQVIEI